MNLFNLLKIVFQCILFTIIVYHISKKEYKIMKSVVLVFILSFLPTFLKAIFQIKFDEFSILIYFIILFMALYLGSSFHFYDKYKWWDRSIHFLSGAGFVGFGLGLIAKNPDMMKFFILLFSFNFSITLHVLWEILEYISDCITHGNAQRWQKIHPSNNHKSEQAIQPAGLVDTMNDFICCLIGSGLATFIWWLLI